METTALRGAAVDAPPTRAGATVLAFLLVLAAIGYLDRVCISTASLAIQRDLGITKTQMGTVFSAFIVCYALFEVPGGWLADRFGPRLVLTRVVASWSLMTALTGAATGFAALGFVWATAWYVWFRDDPHAHPAVNAAELSLIGSSPPTHHPPVPWSGFAGSRNLWLICLMYFSTIYGIYFYLTWLPEYLQTRRGFDLRPAGWLGALAVVGMVIGNVVGGWASDVGSKRRGRRLRRRLPGMLGLPLAAGAILAAMWTTHGLASTALFAAAAGLISMAISPAWAVCLDIGGRHAGVVGGTMTTCGCLGGAVSTMVMGICLNRYDSFDAALLLNAVFAVVGGGAWLMIDASRPLMDATP